MVQKGYFGLLGNIHILVNDSIISYQNIHVYRTETIDMGKISLIPWYLCNTQIQSSY